MSVLTKSFAAMVLAGFAAASLGAADVSADPPGEGGQVVIIRPNGAKKEDKKDEKGKSEKEEKAKPEKKIPAEKLKTWGKQLDSDKHAEREAATRKLREAGRQGLDVLSEAAQGKSAEASSRALEVLKKLYHEHKDKTTKAEAKKVLEKLTKSKNERLARRATDALKPLKEEKKEEQQGQVLQLQGGQGQFQFRFGN